MDRAAVGTSEDRAVRDPMPVFADGSRILFQGDSITDGNRGRDEDPNHILGHGYQFIIASKFGADLAERRLTFINRGVSGDTVAGLSERWQRDALDLRPDLISILVGINDLMSAIPIGQYEQQYDELLARTRTALQGVRLVLGGPFGLPVDPKRETWDEFRADLAARQAIVARLAEMYDAVLVPYQQAFDAAARRAPAEHWIWDGIHPTYAGHQIMADAWVRAVGARWPQR